jgi:hypothetical protein
MLRACSFAGSPPLPQGNVAAFGLAIAPTEPPLGVLMPPPLENRSLLGRLYLLTRILYLLTRTSISSYSNSISSDSDVYIFGLGYLYLLTRVAICWVKRPLSALSG